MTRAANLAEAAGSGFAFRNRIINGDMRIDQRNGGAAVTGEAYLVDRWRTWRNQAYSIQQSSDAPTGFNKSLVVTKTSATPSDYGYLVQYIEGFNVADLGFGGANAQAVTVSFWVKSSVTGTWTVSISNGVARSYLKTYSINSANTWEYKTVTFPGDTSGAWLTDSGKGLALIFDFAGGSVTTDSANTWLSSDKSKATGATNIGATNGATFYLTGVQLEKGATATPFENRLYGTELALCQRYCYQINSDNSSNGGGTGMTGVGTGGTALGRIQTTIPQMRTTPSLALSNVSGTGTDLRVYDGTSVANLTGVITNYSTPNALQFDPSSGTTFTAGKAISVLWQNSIANGYIRLTAEL